MRKRSRIHILFLAWMNSFISLRVQLYSLRWIWEAVITKSNPQRGCTQNSLQTRFGLYDTPSFPLAFLMLLPPPLVWCYIFMEYLDSSWWSISTTSLSFPIPTKNMKNISTSFSSSFVNILSMPSSPSVNSGFLKSFTLGMSFWWRHRRQFWNRQGNLSLASSEDRQASQKLPRFGKLLPPLRWKLLLNLQTSHRPSQERQQFLWSPQCQESFDLLKRKLTSTPVLVLLDISKPFQIFAQAWA